MTLNRIIKYFLIKIILEGINMSLNESCVKCNSTRILYFSARCNHTCFIILDNTLYQGEASNGINMGEGSEYIDLYVCADCGQMQGTWPLQHEAHLLINGSDSESDSELD